MSKVQLTQRQLAFAMRREFIADWQEAAWDMVVGSTVSIPSWARRMVVEVRDQHGEEMVKRVWGLMFRSDSALAEFV